MGKPAVPRRLEQLDSLRGLAALAVVFHHHLMVFPVFNPEASGPVGFWPGLLKNSPLHVFWAGHEAVILFFVLSGFVLSLPFQAGEPVAYFPYLIKRVSRIYLPYLAALAVALTLRVEFARHDVVGLSDWFARTWDEPVTLKAVAEHAALLPSFANSKLNPVLWSLVHEMRISLIFPLLMALVVRAGTRGSLLVGLALSGVGLAGHWASKRFLHYPNDYFFTLHYVMMFIVGALLARHRAGLVRRFLAVPPRLRFLLPLGATVLFTYNWVRPDLPVLGHAAVGDYFILAGSCLFIVWALAASGLARVLEHGWSVFVGRISYSLYLYHALALLAVVHFCYGRLPLGFILALSCTAGLVAAAAAYQAVERPSMALGRLLGGMVRSHSGIRSSFSRDPQGSAVPRSPAGRG
jgi:peptidoglycan/LPS O-acetylase OafA/YrhL